MIGRAPRTPTPSTTSPWGRRRPAAAPRRGARGPRGAPATAGGPSCSRPPRACTRRAASPAPSSSSRPSSWCWSGSGATPPRCGPRSANSEYSTSADNRLPLRVRKFRKLTADAVAICSTSYASAYGSPPSVLVSKPPLPGSGRGPFIGAVNSDSDCGSYATIASFHKVGLGSVLGSTLGGSASVGSRGGLPGPPSQASGSLTKSHAMLSRAASPYATSVVATGGLCGGSVGGGSVVTRLYSPTPATPQTESAYSSYSSYCPRRVAYYATSSVNSFGKPSVSPQVDARLREPLNRVRLLSVPRLTLEAQTLLYEGTFGQVYRGAWRARPGHHEDVLIKTVSDQASELQISVLLSEGLSLAGLSHEHILAPRAVSVEPGERPLLAYGVSIKFGNLKRFLVNSRTGGEGHFAILTKDMVHMSMQVALGVAFLHTHRIWHRDIATRNCIVDPELRVKIADPGLSRDLFPNDYHCLGDSDNRPLAWLAPESLLLRHFSAASDVWAWGVLLWELVTLAGQPYQEVDPFEMADFLRDGYRLAQPASCPDELYGLMAACWMTAPEDRPSMTQLLAGLQEFSAALGHYI
ncbi:hypothetical protein ONE63_007662 [Megalurothrips usitatus]|uniref:Protein kinase domain-containing protein n=1 Tax=Megalurothrips usitatus TaxID=439358 RepID=A0AAV7XNE6_9NEOP|nr:hypothetical protein ONE63_007662 [Megalurothrips usitatus]